MLAALVYAAVRVFTEGNRAEAEAHGRRILRLERTLHISWESALQAPALAHPWLAALSDWIYIWGFWPVLAGAAIFLYARHPSEYALLRNAVFVSGLIGFLFFALLPVAPPRLVDPSLVDTIRQHTGWYRTLAPLKVTNQYAAMPSLHVGWSLLVGIALARASRRRIVYPFAMLLPIAMALAVVMTANHYVLDAVVGAAVAAAALALALHLPELRKVHRPIERPSRPRPRPSGRFPEHIKPATIAARRDDLPDGRPQRCEGPPAYAEER
ncbi:MAG TPA: phosphatase PAP2 family protein [Gaiellaceae bacterium]|nr:phosphatase PAP2 family protein [Gaiellaceae bacterium]